MRINANIFGTKNLRQIKGSCNQKVFLSNRKIRNLLGSWFTKTFSVQILQKLFAVFHNLEKVCANFYNCKNCAQEINFLKQSNFERNAKKYLRF